MMSFGPYFSPPDLRVRLRGLLDAQNPNPMSKTTMSFRKTHKQMNNINYGLLFVVVVFVLLGFPTSRTETN